MSTTDCRGVVGQGFGKRFKGVENFLKRVAFNLGNSPSQTEVKIISCIPIDVSDLQQKILCLEKQLEDSRTFRGDQKRICNTALCESKHRVTYNTGVSCNMLDVDRGTNPLDSLTKTAKADLSKIQITRKSNVSFVPTPRESLEMPPHDNPDVYQPREELYEQFMRPFTVGDTKPRPERKGFFRKKKKFLKSKKPKTQYIYYAQTHTTPFNNVAEDAPIKDTVVTRSYLAEMINKQYKPKPFGRNLSEISKFSTPVCKDTQEPEARCAYESDICSCCHGPFHNIDHQMPKHRILYKTNDSITDGGYYDSTLYDVVPVKEKPLKFKKTMDMPKRREPKPSYDIRCWPEDVRAKLRTYPMYTPLYHNYHTVVSRPDMHYRRSPKMTRREAISKNIAKGRLELDRHIDIASSKSCSINFGSVYPKIISKKLKVDKVLEVARASRKADAECLTSFNNNSECQTDTGLQEPAVSDEKTEETLNQIKNILQSVLHEVKITTLTQVSSSRKDAVVQKGVSHANVANNVQSYIPNNFESNMTNNMQGPATSSLQGHMPGSLPGNMAGNLQCNMPGVMQGNMTGSLQNNMQRNMPINMTGSLQGHIPGSYMGNLQGGYPGNAQDNLLQGSLQGVIPNMDSSRLLNSCTYSPANLNPYLPSCSKHLNSNQGYYQGMKCYHNFPLVLQPPGRQQCSCYRHSSQVRSGYGKQATTIATNTDTVKEEHSKETEKLIKEIYKSMALNMGVVHKDNSLSEYEPVHDFVSHMEKPAKRDLEKPSPIREVKKVTNVVQAVSELFRKKDMQVSSESPNTTTESRLVSNGVSTGSQLVTTTTTDLEVKLRKDRLEKFLNQTKHARPDMGRQDKRQLQAVETHNVVTTVSDSESSSDSETGVTFVPQQSKQVSQKEKKEKQSLLSKMIHSVKLFKPRERRRREKKDNKVDTHDIEESSSDSDDYQTVYSQTLETAPKPAPRVHNLPKRRTHSKISYKQAYPREKSPDKLIRRSPYLEQEYRRHWNEKLMFHDTKHRHSSEHPYSVGSPSRKTPYPQIYEARTVCVDPRTRPTHRTQPVNARRIESPKHEKNLGARTEPRIGTKGLAWLKKHKMGIHCGEQWKKLILEN